MPRTVKCGLIQCSNAAPTDLPVDDIKRLNIEKHLGFIEKAAAQGVQMLCMQEVFTTPYFCAEQQTRWYEAVEKIPDGPTVKLMQEVAKTYGMVIIVPIYEEEITGIYYNTAAVIDADGKYLGKYRKNHIPHVNPGLLGKVLFPSRQSWLSGFRYRLCAHRRLHLLRPPFSRGCARAGLERSRDHFQSVSHGGWSLRVSLEAGTTCPCGRQWLLRRRHQSRRPRTALGHRRVLRAELFLRSARAE